MESERNGRRKPEGLARLKQSARKLFVERGYDSTRPKMLRARRDWGMALSICIIPTSAPVSCPLSRMPGWSLTNMCAPGA
jgi:hypothetical protein